MPLEDRSIGSPRDSRARRPIGAWWSIRRSGRATGSTRSIPWPPAATAIATRHRAPSPMPAMPSRRNLERRAAEIQQALRADQPEASRAVADAFGAAAGARVGVLVSLNVQIAELESAPAEHFDRHPDAEILRSRAGLGSVLGARVLDEFGDDPTRFVDAGGRKAYAGTAPITKASGHKPGGSGPDRAQPATGRRPRAVGLQLAHRQPGRTALVRRPARPRHDPHPGHSPARQPLGRDPACLPGAPQELPRGGRLAGHVAAGRLTPRSRGTSSRRPAPALAVAPARARRPATPAATRPDPRWRRGRRGCVARTPRRARPGGPDRRRRGCR
jgi:hypothetical protein